MRRVDGIALVLVLWLLAMLTALLAAFAVVARTEALQARHLRDSTQARYAAQAGREIAVMRLMETDESRRWLADGREYALEFEGAKIAVSVADESAKLDLNVADAGMLARLFLALEVEEERALRLADAIVDWRDIDDLLQPNGAEAPDYASAGLPYGPKNLPFDLVEELQQVLGMDHALYLRVSPYLTAYSGRPPNPALADAPVLAALGYGRETIDPYLQARAEWTPESGTPAPAAPDGSAFMAAPMSGTYSIGSVATLAGGARVSTHAVVRVGTSGPTGQPYALLMWREGDFH